MMHLNLLIRKLSRRNFWNKQLTIALLALLVLSGCNKKFSDIFDRVGNRLVVDDVEFTYLTAKAKVDFDSDKQSISGTANMRIQKDSIIWVSLSPGLGYEAARILITTDSIFILNKHEKTYMDFSFPELSKKLDFDLNYSLVESVIIGNLIYPYVRERVVKSGDMYSYSQVHSSFHFDNFIGAKTMKLEKVNVKDTLTNNTVSVTYSDFQLVNEEVFPFLIKAALEYQKEGKKKTTIDLEYKQATIEEKPIKFPFNVPQKYEHK